MLWLEIPYGDEDVEHPLLSISQTRGLEDQTEDDILDQFISATTSVDFPQSFSDLDYVFTENFQEQYDPSTISSSIILFIDEKVGALTIPMEISLGRSLIINANLTQDQQSQLVQLLEAQFGAFAWNYTDMKGIHPDTCIHHIYTQENIRPVRQPQRRMNPALKDIVKDELQKLLNADFIYPISDSKWVSPLVIVPKKGGKWRICVEFRELNKATLRDYFPLPFID